MKKKVCILQNGLARGGTDTFVVNLCREIDKERFDVTVVNPSTAEESLVREPEVLAAGATIVHTSPLGKGMKSKLRHFCMLYRLLKDGKYDVFQTNIDLFNGPNLLVAWLAGVPIRCCHSHNGMQQKELVQGTTLSIRIYQSVMRWLCWHFSNRKCGCSEVAMDFLYKGRNWKQNKYPYIIANGINIDSFAAPIDIEAKKRTLGLSARKNILTVGRIIPQKNPLFLAETFCKLCIKRDDCDLVWVGIGPLENDCRKIFREYGVEDRVHFLGSRNDVADIMKCCDLFFMPSAFEGLGIVIIEAQATGMPCVVSEAVPTEADCGKCKYLSLEAKSEEWTNTMSAMLNGEIRLEIDSQRMNNFSIAHMARQMELVFE